MGDFKPKAKPVQSGTFPGDYSAALHSCYRSDSVNEFLTTHTTTAFLPATAVLSFRPRFLRAPHDASQILDKVAISADITRRTAWQLGRPYQNPLREAIPLKRLAN